jgi:hypothetical protein
VKSNRGVGTSEHRLVFDRLHGGDVGWYGAGLVRRSPMNPIQLARTIAATVTDECRKFLWVYTVATRGSEAAKRWQQR